MKHHKKKLAFFCSAMRHFATELRAEGWHVDYVPTDKPGNTGSFTGEIKKAVALHRPNQIFVTERADSGRGSWRLFVPGRGWGSQGGGGFFVCGVMSPAAWRRVCGGRVF